MTISEDNSLGSGFRAGPNPEGDAWPLVSVIMPVRNESAFIARSLGAVLAQDYPSERLEVIVADGMSSDSTRDIVRCVQKRHPNVMLIENPGRTVPTGLNAALRMAKGSIIARVDGHCEMAPDYISQCVRHLEEGNVGGVGGPIETIGESYVARTIALATSSVFGVGGSPFRTVRNRAMHVHTLAFAAYTRRAIEKAGLFDEEFIRGEDCEYNYRLTKLGEKILLSPRIRSRYYSRASLRSLCRQYGGYGFWNVRVLQKHPRQMQWRKSMPALFVGALIILSVMATWTNVGRIALLAVVGAYLAAVLASSVWVARNGGWRHIALLPVVFPALHLSWGIGFIVGLFRFWNRWRARTGKVPPLQGADPDVCG